MLLELLKGVADSIIATVEENKPEIMIYGGAAGLALSGVLAAVAAYKSRPDVDNLKEDISDIEYMEQNQRFPDKPNRYKYFDEETTYTKEQARKDKIDAVKHYSKRIVLRFILPVILAIASFIAIHGGVQEFERINERLVEEVARLTATVAACEDQLAKKLGKEEALNTKYGQTNPETGETKVVVPEEGKASDGTFFIKLDLNKCPDSFWNKDFEDRMIFLKQVEQELQLRVYQHVNKYGGCVIEAAEVMGAIGCRYAYDTDWIRAHTGMRYICKKEVVEISFGLDEAQELRDYERSPKDEVWLHINFNEGVVKPSPRVVKG